MYHQSRKNADRYYLYVRPRLFCSPYFDLFLIKGGKFYKFDIEKEETTRKCLETLCENTIRSQNYQIVTDCVPKYFTRKLISVSTKATLSCPPIICKPFQSIRIDKLIAESIPRKEFIIPTFTFKELWTAAVSGVFFYSETILNEILAHGNEIMPPLSGSIDIRSIQKLSKTFEERFYVFGGHMKHHCDETISCKAYRTVIFYNQVGSVRAGRELLFPWNTKSTHSHRNDLISVSVNESHTEVNEISYVSKFVEDKIRHFFRE